MIQTLKKGLVWWYINVRPVHSVMKGRVCFVYFDSNKV